jgi:hypothetical protein
VIVEALPDRWTWFRLADQACTNPLDPQHAATHGGRWTPPGTFPTLYLDEDVVTARTNVALWLEGKPYGPTDFAAGEGPILVHATLPRNQIVVDVHSPSGIAAVGLPSTYPTDSSGSPVGHAVCQAIGWTAHDLGHRGIRCRSAQTEHGAGRELAWFPATARSAAREVDRQPFDAWFWS